MKSSSLRFAYRVSYIQILGQGKEEYRQVRH
jgi:hypothetical protein